MSLTINWPQSQEAEKGLLGCVLLNGDLAGELREDLFHDLRHRGISGILKEMARDGFPIDVLTVAQRVCQSREANELGGMVYVSQLPECTSSPEQWAHWKAILEDKATLRRVITSGWESFDKAQRPGADVEAMVVAFERSAMSLRAPSGNDEVDIRATLVDVISDLETAHNNPNTLRGITTGFYDLDRMLCGMRDCQMIVIAARPSVGKTSFAMNVAEKAALDGGIPTLVFSLEMSGKELLHRLACSRARVNSSDAYRGYLNEGDFQRLTSAHARIIKSPLHICDKGVSVGEMASLARRFKSRHGIRLVIVDYLGMLDTGEKRRGLYEDISFISHSIKSLAKDLKLPVMVLSQLTRDVEKGDRKPRLSDLRDSGSIEQDADVVCFLHRNGECDSGIQPIELIVAKHRNGPIGKVDLQFHRALTRFESVSALE